MFRTVALSALVLLAAVPFVAPAASACSVVCDWHPVQACQAPQTCANGHTFCIILEPYPPNVEWVPLVEPKPVCGDCECIPALATPDLRALTNALLP